MDTVSAMQNAECKMQNSPAHPGMKIGKGEEGKVKSEEGKHEDLLTPGALLSNLNSQLSTVSGGK
jgi:hypothetical protein